MRKSPALLLTLWLAGGVAVATAAEVATPAPGAENEGARVDVIGSQEAPTVFNVVPWKDKPSRVPRKAVSSSVLRETLHPLDPEVLRREIELQHRLGEAL